MLSATHTDVQPAGDSGCVGEADEAAVPQQDHDNVWDRLHAAGLFIPADYRMTTPELTTKCALWPVAKMIVVAVR